MQTRSSEILLLARTDFIGISRFAGSYFVLAGLLAVFLALTRLPFHAIGGQPFVAWTTSCAQIASGVVVLLAALRLETTAHAHRHPAVLARLHSAADTIIARVATLFALGFVSSAAFMLFLSAVGSTQAPWSAAHFQAFGQLAVSSLLLASSWAFLAGWLPPIPAVLSATLLGCLGLALPVLPERTARWVGCFIPDLGGLGSANCRIETLAACVAQATLLLTITIWAGREPTNARTA